MKSTKGTSTPFSRAEDDLGCWGYHLGLFVLLFEEVFTMAWRRFRFASPFSKVSVRVQPRDRCEHGVAAPVRSGLFAAHAGRVGLKLPQTRRPWPALKGNLKGDVKQ